MFGLINPLRLFAAGTAKEAASEQSPLAMKSVRPELGSNFPRFGIRDFFDYYPLMRFLGYGGSTLAPVWIKKQKHKILSHFGDDASPYSLEEREKRAEKVVGQVEAVAFSGWSLFSFFRDKRMLKNQLCNTLAAEFGMNPGRVGIVDLRRSANPLIESAMDKFFTQNLIRFGTDVWFLKNLTLGIFMKALGITAERSVFVQKTAFEQLSELMYDVRTLSATGRDDLAKRMMRVMQSSFRDHKAVPLDSAALAAHRPLFDHLADAVLENRANLAEVVFVIGGVMLKPEDVKGNLRNLQNVLEKGLKGIAREKYDSGGISYTEKTTDLPVEEKTGSAKEVKKPEKQPLHPKSKTPDAISEKKASEKDVQTSEQHKEAAGTPANKILAEGPKAPLKAGNSILSSELAPALAPAR